jgi:phosphate uptake regulator
LGGFGGRDSRLVQYPGEATYTVTLLREWVEDHQLDPGSVVSLCSYSEGVLTIRADQHGCCDSPHSRKLQLVNDASYSVSLPTDWAQEVGLEQGTEVTLVANDDGSLVIYRDTDTEWRDVVEIDEYEPTELDYLLTAYYLEGVTELALRTATDRYSERRQQVRDSVVDLMGFSVVDETDSGLVVRYLYSAEKMDLRHWLAELEEAVRTLLEEIEAVASGERTEPTMSTEIHRQYVEKKYRLLQRHTRQALTEFGMATKLDVTRQEAFDYATRAERLRSIALDAVVLLRADTEEHDDTTDITTSLLADDGSASPSVEKRDTSSDTPQQRE